MQQLFTPTCRSLICISNGCKKNTGVGGLYQFYEQLVQQEEGAADEHQDENLIPGFH